MRDILSADILALFIFAPLIRSSSASADLPCCANHLGDSNNKLIKDKKQCLYDFITIY